MTNYKRRKQDSKNNKEGDATLSLHRAILAAQEIENVAAESDGTSTKTSEADPEKLTEEDQSDKDRNNS